MNIKLKSSDANLVRHIISLATYNLRMMRASKDSHALEMYHEGKAKAFILAARSIAFHAKLESALNG